MIKVENQDFEFFRSELYAYAMGLLRQRGSGCVLYAEHDEKAKDIVQECYLVFHKSRKDIFVTQFHLKSYLKICLYNCYRYSINNKNRIVQYNLFKTGNLEVLDTTGQEDKLQDDDKQMNIKHDVVYEQLFHDNYIHKFLETLNENQREILNKLMDGWKATDLYKEKGISRQAFHSAMSHIKKRYIIYENKNS